MRTASKPESNPLERRSFGRRTVCKAGTIIDHGGGRTSCIVVDVAPGGVALRAVPQLVVPDEFLLLIEADDVIVHCEVVHRNDGRVGARYVRSPRRASRVLSPASVRTRKALSFLMGEGAGAPEAGRAALFEAHYPAVLSPLTDGQCVAHDTETTT